MQVEWATQVGYFLKWSPVIPCHQSKQTLTFPPGSSIQQCQITLSLVPSLSAFILRPNYCPLVPAPGTEHWARGRTRRYTRLPVSHTSLALRLGHTEPGNTQAAPGSQPRTEIKELCSELQFPTWGSGAPESAQLRQKCLLSGTHGQPQLDPFLNGLSKSQDISTNYLNPELFVLHCHCLFKHNKNHQAPLPRSAILLKPSKSQENKIMSGKKEAVKPCSVHYRKMAFYWAAHCKERRDTQEGCKHQAAPRSHLW